MIKVIDIGKYPAEKVVAYWVSQGGKDIGKGRDKEWPYVGIGDNDEICGWPLRYNELELIDLPLDYVSFVDRFTGKDRKLIPLPDSLDDSESPLETILKSDPHSRYTAPEDQAVIHRCHITLTSVSQVRKTSVNRIIPSEVTSYEIIVGVRLNSWIEFEMNIFSQAPMSEDEIIDDVLDKLRS
jgi:hypothetical protein